VPDVRYVCLSDLHLGAESSILTRLDSRTLTADLHTPSPALEGLLDCLEHLTKHNEIYGKPTLILAGDIFELALAKDNDAAMVFEMFAKRAFGQRGIFDDTVYFIPGNHDHHLWEGARETQYSEYVQSRDLDADLEAPWHTTRMRAVGDEQPVYSRLLATLATRALRGDSAVNVRVVYPNLALDTDSSDRHVFIHHGHFTEAMYILMSTMQDMVFPDQDMPWVDAPIWDWEAENFAWIDFFWSTLGRSGAVGRDVGVIYASLQSRDALRPLGRNLARALSEKAPVPELLRRLGAGLMTSGIDWFAGRAKRLERGRKEVVLSPGAQKGLQLYLESPLLHQITTEYKEYRERKRVSDDVTFVFGHTHKPFEDLQWFAGYDKPVRLYNTGGWVVDAMEPRPRHGGAAILFDDNLDSASVRFFNQSGDQSSYRVTVAHCGRPNPFAEQLTHLVEPDRDPWRTFSRDAANLVEERHQALRRIIEQVQGGAPGRAASWRG
jgi:Calcineurin-like phosphoesterase